MTVITSSDLEIQEKLDILENPKNDPLPQPTPPNVPGLPLIRKEHPFLSLFAINISIN